MSKVIDISGMLTNERPTIKLAEDKIYEVDDSKNTVLKFELAIEKKDLSEIGAMDELIAMTLGKKAAKEIDDMNLSLSAYQPIIIAIMAALSKESFEDTEARFRKEAGLQRGLV